MGSTFDNNTPIYLQIAELLKIKIISGEYPPGARLQSVRDLAITLKANPNTVQRALGELENERLIFTERTNGKFVTDDESFICEQKGKYAASLTVKYLNCMKEIGVDAGEAADLIKKTGGK